MTTRRRTLEPEQTSSSKTTLIVLGIIVVAAVTAFMIFVYPPLRFHRILNTLESGSKDERHWAVNDIVPYGEQAVPPLVEFASAGDDTTGRYAAMALAKLRRKDEALELLKASRAQTRVNAIRILARLDDATAHDAVIGSLTDTDAVVKRVACEWIGLSKIKKGFDGVLALIEDDSDEVRQQAAIALGKISGPEKIQLLVDLAASSDNARVRSELANVLTSEAFEPRSGDILTYMESKCGEASRDAGLAYALLAAKLGGDKGGEIVELLLAHADADVRAQAVRGVAHLDRREVVPRLVEMVLKDTQAPCEAAMKGLLKFEARGHDQSLQGAAKNGEEFRRYCALRLLAVAAQRSTIPVALQRLDDGVPRVADQAHETLIAVARKAYGITPRVQPTRTSWKNWLEKIDKEMDKIKAIDDKIATIERLIGARTEYKRVETMCKEVEDALNHLKTELIITSKRSIERKLEVLRAKRYQAFKMQTLERK